MNTEEYQKFIEDLKFKFDTDTIWSFSRVNSFKTDPYGWFLRYVKHEPSDKESGNAYGIYGNMVHDIMEDYYKGEISREQCRERFDEEFDKLSLTGLKFNNTDDASDKKLKEKYKEDIDDFMDNFATIEGEYLCEYPISMLLKNEDRHEGFFGYIDFLNKKDDKYLIIDYKTSTMYKGKDVYEHAKQLLLYAIGLRLNTRCAYEDITVGWNFLKYVWVQEEQKNGKIKDRYIERCKLGETLENSLTKWMTTLGHDDMSCINKAVITNDLSDIPEDVLDKFAFKDCIITVDFNQETEQNLVDNLLEECYNIRQLVKQYEETSDDSIFMWEPTQKDEFYYYNLCDYSTKIHKAFAKYFNDKEEQERAKEETPWVDKKEDELSSFFNAFNLE